MIDLAAAPVWRHEPGWFFLSRAAPALAEDLVIARCAHSVLALEREGGALRWRTELEPGGGNETFLLPLAGGGWVTDLHRHPERLTSVVALDPDGGVRWRADLPAIGSGRGAVLAGGRLVLPAKQPGAGQRVLVFDDPARDGAWRDLAVEGGVTHAAAAGEHVIAADAFARPGGAGLRRLALDGGAPAVLATGRVLDLAAAGPRAIAILDEPGGPVAAAFDAATGARGWSAAVSAPVLAASEDRVVTFEAGAAVCRRAADGAVLWAAAPEPGAPGHARIAGDLAIAGRGRAQVVRALEGGAVLGALPGGLGPPAVAAGALYAAGERAVVRLAHPGAPPAGA